jgi:hypothetical protein
MLNSRLQIIDRLAHKPATTFFDGAPPLFLIFGRRNVEMGANHTSLNCRSNVMDTRV